MVLAGSLSVSTLACGEPSFGDLEGESRYADLSGEDLYSGLFFGLGPAAELLPEVHQISLGESPQATDELLVALREAEAQLMEKGDVDQASLREAIEKIEGGRVQTDVDRQSILADLMIAQIESIEPGFFSRFASQLQSGDPVQVDQAMGRAAALTAEARKLAHSTDMQSFRKQEAFALALASVLALVVAVWSGVVIVEGLWVVTTKAQEDPNSLLRDEIVARITKSVRRPR